LRSGWQPLDLMAAAFLITFAAIGSRSRKGARQGAQSESFRVI
jgi:hypothetical protein